MEHRSPKDKGTGRIPWEKWRTQFALEALASGELQQLKAEIEEGAEPSDDEAA